MQSGPPQTTAAGVPASVPATSSLPQSAPEPPTAPVLGAPTVVPKRLTLAWGEVERAATYQVQRLMPDGSWSAEGAPIPAPATSATLPIAAHLLDWNTVRYRVLACNVVGCTASADVGVADKMLDAIAYGKASNTEAGDAFGKRLALSADGSTLAVGAFLEDGGSSGINGDMSDNSLPNSGAVYVYVRSGDTWIRQAYLKAAVPAASDFFGLSLSLSADGNTLVVGAPTEDGGSAGVNGDQTVKTLWNSGAAYVFVRSGTTWTQQAYLKAASPDGNDWFGATVAISAAGDTIAVGAPREDSGASGVGGDANDNTIPDSGAAYVFVRSGTTWAQQAYVKASNPGNTDLFGDRLALSADGRTLVVGATAEDSSATGVGGNEGDNAAIDSGAAYVFVRAMNGWTQQAYLKASNTAAGDQFGMGISVSADGSTVVVGAVGEDGGSSGVGGNQADRTRPDAGAAYVFVRIDGVWMQQAYLKASVSGANDRFGGWSALSADGSILAISADDEDGASPGVGGDATDDSLTDSGAVYVYVRTGSTWTLRSYVKAANPRANAAWMWSLSVALDATGTTLVAGFSGEPGASTDFGGDRSSTGASGSGAVYVY